MCSGNEVRRILPYSRALLQNISGEAFKLLPLMPVFLHSSCTGAKQRITNCACICTGWQSCRLGAVFERTDTLCSAHALADWGTAASRQWDGKGNLIYIVLLGVPHHLNGSRRKVNPTCVDMTAHSIK